MAAAPAPTKLRRVISDIGDLSRVNYFLPAIIPRETGLGKDDGCSVNADISEMRWRTALMLLTVLAAGACEPAARPPPPYFTIPAASAAPAEREAVPEGAPSRRPLVTNSNPEIQYFLPSHPGDIGREAAPAPEAGRSAGPFYTPPYSGPITGYGPGGLAQPPGAPPNPPYPPGGLMH